MEGLGIGLDLLIVLVTAIAGGMLARLSKIASHRDELILEERQRTADDRIEREEEEEPVPAGEDAA